MAEEFTAEDAATARPNDDDPMRSAGPASERDSAPRGRGSAGDVPGGREHRLAIALRQAALMGVALLVAGLVTARLRPDEVVDRQISSASYLWAIVIWAAVLLFDAVAFDQSQMRRLEGPPLIGGGIAGAIVFVIGLIGVGADSVVARVVYSLANALGAAMFWWALLSLGLLVITRISPERNPT